MEKEFIQYGYDEVFEVNANNDKYEFQQYLSENSYKKNNTAVVVSYKTKYLYKYIPKTNETNSYNSLIELYQMASQEKKGLSNSYYAFISLEHSDWYNSYNNNYKLRCIEDVISKNEMGLGVFYIVDYFGIAAATYELSPQDYIYASINEQRKAELYSVKKTYQALVRSFPLTFYLPHAKPGQIIGVNNIVNGFTSSGNIPDAHEQNNESKKYFFKNYQKRQGHVDGSHFCETHVAMQIHTKKEEAILDLKYLISYTLDFKTTKEDDVFFCEIESIKIHTIHDSNIEYDEEGNVIRRYYENAGFVKKDNDGKFYIVPGAASYYEKQHDNGILQNGVMTAELIKRERFFPRQIFTMHADVTLVNPNTKKKYTMEMYIPGALYVDLL